MTQKYFTQKNRMRDLHVPAIEKTAEMRAAATHMQFV